MRLNQLALPIFATLSLATAMPALATAQHRGNDTQRVQNAQDTANMRMRLEAAVQRVKVTEQHGKISPARSVAVCRQLVQAQRDLAQQRRRHGSLSANQLAPYGRLVVAVDAELGAGASGHAYGEDALPSAEVTAFKRSDARLRYRNASIQYDAHNCAVYQGTTRDGQVRREPLLGADNRPICAR